MLLDGPEVVPLLSACKVMNNWVSANCGESDSGFHASDYTHLKQLNLSHVWYLLLTD